MTASMCSAISAKRPCSLDIRTDLEAFGVRFDTWFSEASLLKDNSVKGSIEELLESRNMYEQDGALWLRSTTFGDDKDRVVVKQDKSYTYLATDIAYHRNKLARGFKTLVNIWGADHHGYIPRVQAVIQAFGHPKDSLHVLLVQLVAILRNGQPVPMSKRAGNFVTLRDVVQDVGSDAARFIFLTRRSDSHLDFDLDIAKEQSRENPVYYVQYAHARLASLFREAETRNIAIPTKDAVDISHPRTLKKNRTSSRLWQNIPRSWKKRPWPTSRTGSRSIFRTWPGCCIIIISNTGSSPRTRPGQQPSSSS